METNQDDTTPQQRKGLTGSNISVNVGLKDPAKLDVESFQRLCAQEYNGDFVITGVPTDSKGRLKWNDFNDLVSNPHSHGLLLAIDTISQIYKSIDTFLVFEGRDNQPLNIRFAAKITDVFGSYSNRQNPSAWIHLGHGNLEHSIELLEDLEEWEDEELESVPGISNGHEDGDFISTRWLRDVIKTMKGNILFMSLPICYGYQISEVLAESQSIHCIHAPISFSVSETLEFYDCNSSKILPGHTTIYWTDWVKAIEKTLVSAISKSILEEESC